MGRRPAGGYGGAWEYRSAGVPTTRGAETDAHKRVSRAGSWARGRQDGDAWSSTPAGRRCALSSTAGAGGRTTLPHRGVHRSREAHMGSGHGGIQSHGSGGAGGCWSWAAAAARSRRSPVARPLCAARPRALGTPARSHGSRGEGPNRPGSSAHLHRRTREPSPASATLTGEALS
ncbi:hypothetical protein GALL_337640 [mine drainage metagenome]|uniref:Uncharacterized protein n=1 Tax=mine drainage metagenome TaxID=410659 RepID=A0A1J5R8E7_9ZZZZ